MALWALPTRFWALPTRFWGLQVCDEKGGASLAPPIRRKGFEGLCLHPESEGLAVFRINPATVPRDILDEHIMAVGPYFFSIMRVVHFLTPPSCLRLMAKPCCAFPAEDKKARYWEIPGFESLDEGLP